MQGNWENGASKLQRAQYDVQIAFHRLNFAAQARQALGATDPGEIVPELARLAAGQASRTAVFFSEGLARASDDEETSASLAASGSDAAAALSELASFLEQLAEEASGPPRLGDLYPQALRLGLDRDLTPDTVLDQAAHHKTAHEAPGTGHQVNFIVHMRIQVDRNQAIATNTVA